MILQGGGVVLISLLGRGEIPIKGKRKGESRIWGKSLLWGWSVYQERTITMGGGHHLD